MKKLDLEALECAKEDEVVIKNFIESRPNPKNYYVENGLVCCNRDVIILDEDIVDGHFPVKFGRVDGSFCCHGCNSLTSLEGSPEYVGDIFDCSFCDSLTSLKGSPKKVKFGFNCSECDLLTSLEGAPEYVGGDFNCSYCPSLTSLKGSPEYLSGGIYFNNCEKLKF